MRLRWLALCLPLLAGCGTVHQAFTEPTGKVTLDRQELIDAYATVRVLYGRLRAAGEAHCLGRPTTEERGACFTQLHDLDARAKVLNVQIEAKIAVPESRMDWGAVMGLLKVVVSLVP